MYMYVRQLAFMYKTRQQKISLYWEHSCIKSIQQFYIQVLESLEKILLSYLRGTMNTQKQVNAARLSQCSSIKMLGWRSWVRKSVHDWNERINNIKLLLDTLGYCICTCRFSTLNPLKQRHSRWPNICQHQTSQLFIQPS